MNTEPYTEADLKLIDDILATYHRRIAAIEATKPGRTYVLSWGDGRYVHIEGTKPSVTGYENATFFASRDVAGDWLRKGLTDGARFAPNVLPAGFAKQGALNTLRQVIKTVERQRFSIAAFV